MADAIVRLRVESSEYDQKLSRATQQLQHMEKEVRRTGATFAYADKEELEFVRSLGSMETKADSAKGKIAEMTKSFTELSLQYNRLTKEEKASPFGQALAASLDQLKGRIKATEGDLKGVSQELGGGGLSKVMETLGSKIGIPAGAFTALGGAMAAGAAAAKVAKDAFLATEGGIDTWGRTVEGAKGAYSVFLDTLNNGNWSNFFSNLSNAIKGSRQLYDEMDRLGSIKANNQAAIAKEQATIQELRLRQQKGENVAAELRAAEERLRKLQTESVDQGKTVGRDQMKQAITNSVNSIKGNGSSFLGINFRKDTTAKVSDEQINAAIDDILNNGQAAMDKYAQAFKDLQTKGTKTWTETQYSQGGVAYQVTKSEFDINQLSAEEQALYKLSKAITDTETKLQEGIGTYTQALQEEASTNREAFQTERFAQRGDRAAAAAKAEEKAPEGSIKAMREQLAELNKEWELAVDDDSRAKLKEQIEEVTKALEQMTGKAKEAKPALQIEGPSGYSQEGISALRGEIQGGMKGMQMGSDEYMFQSERLVDLTAFENLLKTATANGIQIDPAMLEGLFEQIDNATFSENALELVPSVSDEAWQALVDTINAKLADLGLDPIELDVKTGNVKAASEAAVTNAKDTASAWQNAVAAVNNVGSALQSIEDPAAKVSGIVMQAIANVALGFAQASASAATGAAGVFGWIAAATAGVATMVSTIAAIKSATSGSYANGGLIGGNSFSGDNLTANVNSGELILNRAQQSNIAGQLEGNPMDNMQLETRISGTDMLIFLNNTNRSLGGSRSFYSERH